MNREYGQGNCDSLSIFRKVVSCSGSSPVRTDVRWWPVTLPVRDSTHSFLMELSLRAVASRPPGTDAFQGTVIPSFCSAYKRSVNTDLNPSAKRSFSAESASSSKGKFLRSLAADL